MTCAQCFLVVSKDCPHCRELLHRAKDAVELLTKRGLIIINVEDFPETEHLATYSVQDGDLRLMMATPQVVCLAKTERGGWVRVYQHVVKSPEEFHEIRRFLEAKLHWLKLQFGRHCFETRGRKPKRAEEEGKAEAAAQEAKKRGRKKRGREEESQEEA